MDKQDFAPHAKSARLGKLAPHIAGLAGFGTTVLTTPGFDFSGPAPQPTYATAAELVQAFDENVAKTREALKNAPDEAWTQNWKLTFQGHPIFNGSRFLAYREMFLNHLVHHRAQLGVYLRMTETNVPATYGPSADEALAL